MASEREIADAVKLLEGIINNCTQRPVYTEAKVALDNIRKALTWRPWSELDPEETP